MKSASLTISIWSHDDDIAADVSDLPELFAPHVAHVQEMAQKGCFSGEIVDDNFLGWWSIKED